MGNTLSFPTDTHAGQTVVAHVHDAAGQIWRPSTSAFEATNGTRLAAGGYDLATTETVVGVSGVYLAAHPAAAAGTYRAVAYVSGAYTVPVSVQDWYRWDGAAVLFAPDSLALVKAKTDTLTGDVTVQSAGVEADGDVRIVVGDGYESSTRKLVFTFANWAGPSLAGATAAFRMADYAAYIGGGVAPPNVLNAAGTVAVDGTTVTVTVVLAESLTDDLATPPNPGRYPTHKYQLIATTAASEDVTMAIGNAFAVRRITPAA